MNAAALETPLINLAEIAEIEFYILKRMRQLAMGDHASVYTGAGFNFVGAREWEPGDNLASVDWAQSSLTNFSPIITRQFEQDSNATVIAVADGSASTYCGMGDDTILTIVHRCLAAIGLSAVLCQDSFGMMVFGAEREALASERPRIGRPHVIHCLRRYDRVRRERDDTPPVEITRAVAGYLRKTSMIPVVSDFLFADAPRVVEEFALLNGAHDVFLLMVDARHAFELPPVSAGWIEAYDLETGTTRVFSRREFARLGERVAEWQERIRSVAREHDIDVLQIGLDRWQMENTLVEFLAERRLRKVKM
jgi:uncharacterized protein (DUF58 family)